MIGEKSVTGRICELDIQNLGVGIIPAGCTGIKNMIKLYTDAKTLNRCSDEAISSIEGKGAFPLTTTFYYTGKILTDRKVFEEAVK